MDQNTDRYQSLSLHAKNQPKKKNNFIFCWPQSNFVSNSSELMNIMVGDSLGKLGALFKISFSLFLGFNFYFTVASLNKKQSPKLKENWKNIWKVNINMLTAYINQSWQLIWHWWPLYQLYGLQNDGDILFIPSIISRRRSLGDCSLLKLTLEERTGSSYWHMEGSGGLPG